MKNAFLLLITLVCSVPYSFSQWEVITTVPTNLNLLSVKFANENTGYAVGDYGTILKSSDTGISWVNLISQSTQNLKDIYINSSNFIFAVGENGTNHMADNTFRNYLQSPVCLFS
ncbi:MAG: YCF48-related protein [Bacteroidia bacterium]|nr:YCF48-related protein [Bacteroidia bacterium]